jgi:hypothetical protein
MKQSGPGGFWVSVFQITIRSHRTSYSCIFRQNIVLRNILRRVKYYGSKIFCLKIPGNEKVHAFNAGGEPGAAAGFYFFSYPG